MGGRKKFKKVVEDFICLNCEEQVMGNGYTNHCPCCLYSRHVDQNNPGDRASECGGLMKPVGLKLKSGNPEKILFCCMECQKEIWNKVAKNDDFNMLKELEIL